LWPYITLVFPSQKYRRGGIDVRKLRKFSIHLSLLRISAIPMRAASAWGEWKFSNGFWSFFQFDWTTTQWNNQERICVCVREREREREIERREWERQCVCLYVCVRERERIIGVRCRRMCHDTLYAPWVQHTQAIFLSLSLTYIHTHTHTHTCRKNHYDWRRKTSFILLTKKWSKSYKLEIKITSKIKVQFSTVLSKIKLKYLFY